MTCQAFALCFDANHESQCGRTSDALDHLRHAIEMSEEFRDSAKDDSDLDAIRDEPAFKQLIGS